ncbi:MAG: hypothetical protein ABGY41_17290 [Candidatus Poribacteria bacterium]
MVEDHPGYGYRRICPELSGRLAKLVSHEWAPRPTFDKVYIGSAITSNARQAG